MKPSFNRLHLWWLRWRYIKVMDSGALSIDPRWYIETGALALFWNRASLMAYATAESRRYAMQNEQSSVLKLTSATRGKE